MKQYLTKILIAGLFFVASSSCIKNDFPYPYIESIIQEIEVDDMIESAEINGQSKNVNIKVSPHANLAKVKITKLIVSENAKIIPDKNVCENFDQFPTYSYSSLDSLPANANTIMDFQSPAKIVLYTYQEHIWTINVTKANLVRTIEVENQIGNAQIDEKNKRIIIYVSTQTPFHNIHIKSLQLEGEGVSVLPDPATVTDFSHSHQFHFFQGEEYISTWTVDVQHLDVSSTIGETEVWATWAILKGGIASGSTPIIEYKKATETEWTILAQEHVSTGKTDFSAKVTGLKDGTDYEWRISVNNIYSETGTFTTEKIVEIPNLNFDTWTQSGKNWFANADAADSYWASGNTGITAPIAGNKDPITIKTSDAVSGSAAEMHTTTGVTLVGSAAGNLFIGSYKTNMQNPSASPTFGRSYNGARPTKMKGYYKYLSQPINYGSYPGNLVNDECHIYLKIWDANDNLFGYGEFIGKETVTEYKEFEFEVKYNDLKAKPAKISIVATSSHYGGDFEGVKVIGQVGNGSTLWVDEFQLIYD